MTVQFNQEDPNYEKLTACGNTRFTIDVNMKVINGGTEKKIIFSDRVIKTFEYNKAELGINKQVIKDGDYLKYTIKVTSQRGINSNVTIQDQLANPEYLIYEEGSLQYGKSTTSLTSVKETKIYPDKSGFQYIIDHTMSEGEIVYLQYRVKINYDKLGINKSMTAAQSANTATVISNEAAQMSATATYTQEVIPWTINKTAGTPIVETDSDEDKYTSTVDWTITIDSNNKGNTEGAKIVDTLTDSSNKSFGDPYFAGSGLTVLIKQGAETITKSIDWNDSRIVLYDASGNITTNIFKAKSWKYTIDDKNVYQIKYRTITEILNKNTSTSTTYIGTNKVDLQDKDGNITSTKTVKIPAKGPGITVNSTISKTMITTNDATDEVTWEIKAGFNIMSNDNGTYTAIITDILPNNNGYYDKYIEANFNWEGESGSAVITKIYDETTHKIIFTVTGITKETTGKLIIYVKTRVNREKNLWTIHTNTATISGLGAEKTVTANATIKQSISIINKTVENINEETDEVTWKIEATYNAEGLDNITSIITDILPRNGTEYDEYIDTTYEWNGASGEAVVTKTYDETTHQVIYTVTGITKETTGKLIIHIKTKFNRNVDNWTTHTNRAIMRYKGIDQEATADATCKYNTSSIDKTVVNSSEGKITWEIDSKFDIVKSDNNTYTATIVDTLGSNDTYEGYTFEWEGESGGAVVEETSINGKEIVYTVTGITKETTGKLKIFVKTTYEATKYYNTTNEGGGELEVTGTINKTAENVNEETDEVTWKIETNLNMSYMGNEDTEKPNNDTEEHINNVKLTGIDGEKTDSATTTVNIKWLPMPSEVRVKSVSMSREAPLTFTITDEIPWIEIDNVKYYDEYIESENEWRWEGESGGAVVTKIYDETTHKIIFTVTGVTEATTGKLVITIKTKFNRNSPKWETHTNKAILAGINDEPQESTAEVTCKYNESTITKTTEIVDANTDEVTWKIEAEFQVVKSDNNQHTAIITDILPNNNEKYDEYIEREDEWEWEGNNGGATVTKTYDSIKHQVVYTVTGITKETVGKLIIHVKTKFNRENNSWITHINNVEMNVFDEQKQAQSDATCLANSSTISKIVENTDKETDEVTWKIEATFNMNGATNYTAIITENIPNYSGYYDTYLSTDYKWEGESGGAVIEEVSNDGKKIVYAVTGITKETTGKLIIHIKTKFNRGIQGWTKHNNTVSMIGPEGEKNADAEAWCEQSSTTIDKKVEIQNNDKDEITWKIEAGFNASGEEIIEAIITDTLPNCTYSGKKYYDELVNVRFEWSGEKGNAEVIRQEDQESHSVIYKVINIDRKTTGKLIIYVTTKINREASTWTTHQNYVRLESNVTSTQNKSAQAYCPQTTATISKTVEKIEAETNEITWKIEATFKAQGLDKFDATITDTLPKYSTTYDEYLGYEAKWEGNNGDAEIKEIIDETTHQVRYIISNITKETTGKLIIYVKTKSNRTNVNWTKHTNYATLQYHTRTPQANAYVTYPSITPTITKNKISETIDENASPTYTYILRVSGILTDTITIEDILNMMEYFEIDEDSIEIYGSDTIYNSSSYQNIINEFVKANAQILKEDTIKMILNLQTKEGTIGNASKYFAYYYIKYNVKVKDEKALEGLKQAAYSNTEHTLQITNTAQYKGAISNRETSTYTYNPISKKMLETPSIDNNYVGKFLITVNEKGYDMDVEADEIRIIDTMTNMQIKPSTIVVKANGKIIDAIYTIDGNGIITFIVPDGQKIEIAYSADIQGIGDIEIGNTAQILGIGNASLSSQNIIVNVIGEGEASNRGIIIHKIDEKTGAELEGAEFILYEVQENEDGTFTIIKPVLNLLGEEIKFITGKDGTTRIYGDQEKDGWVLELNKVYALIEIKAPEGYKVSEEPIYFMVGTEKNTPYTYLSNEIITIGNKLEEPEETEKPEEIKEEKKEERKTKSPQTGDNIGIWFNILTISAIGLILTSRKTKKEE